MAKAKKKQTKKSSKPATIRRTPATPVARRAGTAWPAAKAKRTASKKAPKATPIRAVDVASPHAPTSNPATAVNAARPTPPAPRITPSQRPKDVAVASFGPPRAGLEAVIGEDERTRVPDTTAFPFRAIASLLIVAADDSNWVGTGWFISPRTLLTAGHCVFIHSPLNPARHGWVKHIQIIPARNEDDHPFDSAVSSDFRSSEGWTVNGDPQFDYGAIVLDAPLGDQTGVFGFEVAADDDLLDLDATITGYPSDQPPGTQWLDRKRVASVNDTKVFYDIDTAGGQSGAPVYRMVDEQPIAIAIHAYGVGGRVRSNSGTRITQEVHANLVAWKG